eukprot:5427461-Prymnesium_polylepis.1
MALAVLNAVDRAVFGTDRLDQYHAALTGDGGEILLKLERNARRLHMFTNLGDFEGLVQACDALTEMCRSTRQASEFGPAINIDQAVLDQGVLTSLTVVLGRENQPESSRAAAELLAELASGAEQRRALMHSGVLKPLVLQIRKASDPRLLRE